MLITWQGCRYVVVDDLISQEAASRLHDDAVHLRRDGMVPCWAQTLPSTVTVSSPRASTWSYHAGRLLAPNPPPQGREDAARMAGEDILQPC